MERSGVTKWTPRIASTSLSTEDGWIRDRLNACAKTANESLKLHRYHEAGQGLWDFVWHEFCDWYLEVKKLRFRENSGQDDHWTEALTIYESVLRLLHPFMPFITEELWQRLADTETVEHPVSISLAAYPEAGESSTYKTCAQHFSKMQQIVTSARELRADNKLDPKSILPASLYLRGYELTAQDLSVIAALAKLNFEQYSAPLLEQTGLIRSTPDFELRIFAAPASQNGASGPEARTRIEKEIAKLERAIENSRGQLSDSTFLSKAPENVVASLRAKLAGYENQLAKNKKLLEGFA
jgi:valyl-tRNA synthetase